LISLSCKRNFLKNDIDSVKTDTTALERFSFERNIDITTPKMNGSDIMTLQEQLIKLGFTGVGEIDGYYGTNTGGEIYFIKEFLGHDTSLKYLVDEVLWRFIFDNANIEQLNTISSIRQYIDNPNQYFFREINITDPEMKGSDIMGLQKKLLELGFTEIDEIDGYYGSDTADVILFIKNVYAPYDNYDESYKKPDYLVDRKLWETIFDPKNAMKMKSIAIIKLFDGVRPRKGTNVTVAENKGIVFSFYEEGTEEYYYQNWHKEERQEYYYNVIINDVYIDVYVTETIKASHEYYEEIIDYIISDPIDLHIRYADGGAESHAWSGYSWQ
jgi:hypothetical protein